MDHFLGCFTISRCKCDSPRCSSAADVSVAPGARRRGRPGWTTSRRGQDSPWKSQLVRMTEDRDEWRKYFDGVDNPRGSRTAEEQNSCALPARSHCGNVQLRSLSLGRWSQGPRSWSWSVVNGRVYIATTMTISTLADPTRLGARSMRLSLFSRAIACLTGSEFSVSYFYSVYCIISVCCLVA